MRVDSAEGRPLRSLLHRRTLAANEETKDDDGDDDVEAHRRVNV